MHRYIKTTVFLLFLLLMAHYLQAQGLADYNQKRLDINKTGMMILGSWAIGNMVINPIAGRGAIGEDKYFYQMNTWWNAVNIIIAGAGYYGVLNEDPSSLSLYQTMQEQHKIEKILLVNAALDIGYMVGGFYLIERAKNATNKPERLKGFGKAVILQGGFLFLFDTVLYLMHSNQASQLQNIFEQVAIGPTGFSFRHYF